MKEEIKQTIEAVSSHPKAAIVVTGVFTSNVWLDYGEPVIKGLTSIVGLAVLIALLVQRILEIKKSLAESHEDK